MADQPGDDTHDYVVVPRPGNAHGVEYSTGEPPHVIQELKIWLSPTDSTSPASEYRKHLNSRAPGTGKWILDTDQYRRWSDTDRIGDLWIRGIPGSGKSVVAASMVDGLQQRGDAPVLFFFFREIIETNRSPRSLSRDFCHGLLAHSTLLQSTLKKLKGQNPNVGTVPFSEIWECLSSALAAMPKVYCVVDALDEMEPGHGQFLHDLLNLGRKSPKSIKLILTSRQLPHLEKHLGGSCLLDLRLDRRNVDRDIAIYITQRFKSEATLTKDEASEIKVAICERGKGLFLYARLVTDQLLLHPTIILPQLSQLPDGLGSMYTDILRDHAARSQTTAEFQRLVLEWVVYSARPLRLIELATMVDSLADRGGLSASQNAKLAIRSTCGPLLEVCEDGVIQIIHHSLAEFLLNRDVCHIQDARNYREFAVLNDQIAHENIARACVSYFTCCYMEGLEQYTHNTEAGNRALWQRFHFLRYASENWPYHASKVNPTKDFLSFLDGFFDRPACFASWANLWDDPDIRVCSKLTSLHVAAHSGLCAYTEHLLVNGADPECLDGYNRTPLTYAAIQGHSKIAQILLDHKARYNLIDDDMMGPMHYAAKLNQAEVVRVLLDAGANPLASVQHKEPDESGSYRGKYGNFDEGETPLSYACRHGNARIFMELQNYIDPLTLRRGFLHLAAESSQAKIVSLLLSHEEVRCGINDLNCKGNTALYIAARYQSSEAVQTLLKHGADISIRSQERSTKPGHPEASQIIEGQERSFTPLHGWAQLPGFGQISWRRCDERSREVLQLLIKAGCDINATDHKGRTSLFAWGEFWNDFSGGKSAAFLSLLLENGADASIVDLDGGSPLHQIQHHREKRPVVELLVGAGADINAARVTDGMTPVHLIAKGGSWTDPLLLSQLKADFTRQDLQGNTPLHYVCQEWRRISRYKEAWLSLSDLNIQNHAGRTPLAEFLGHNYGNETREDLALFIDWGASLETRDYQGRTALLISLSRIFRRRRQWIPELLRLGANVNATSFRGKSVLHYAASPGDFSGDESVEKSASLVRMLIDAGADINSVDHDGNSVFHETITKGWRWARYHTEALIELNVPLHIPNYQGRTALHLAATVDDDRGRETTRKGRVTRLEFLLHPQLKFDINAKDHQGVTPLHLAAATSDINTRQLISHGADIHAKTIQGRTPLHYAAKAGQPNSVGILQEAYRSRSLLLDDLSVECRTALHEAARSGRYESVKLLLDAGSQPDIRDGRGRTPLHAAAEFDQVPYFRRRRAYDSTEKQARKRSEEINEKLGRSGLIIDSEEDSLSAREVVRLLLAAGVDPVQRDNDNKTALDVALILGLSDVVDELAPVLAGIYASVENSPILEPIGETLSSSTRVDLGNLLRTMPASAYNDAILKRVVSTGNVKLIEQLLHSSRANLTEKDRVSALHLCARWGLLSMAKSMLPYVQNLQDLLPSLLDSATKRSLCNIEMVKLLIQSVVHATANGKQFNSSDALHRLAWGRYWWHPRALTILLESGADTELLDRGSTPLQTSLRAGAPHVSDIGLWCDETFGILIRFGADVNSSSGKSETSPLQDALESKRDLSLVQKLLDGGASVEGNQAIASAIKAENTAALELLLKSGADPNVLYTIKEPYGEHQQETPLKHASGKNEEAMELLLAHGANPHQPLHDGASSVLHDICSLNRRLNPIISAGYDLEKRDSQGRTPLLRACNLRGSDWHLARSRWDSTCSATELLHAGVDVTAVDDSGSTALHYAICSSMDKVVDELLRRGASSVARNKHGLTPIHCVLVGRTHLSKISSYHDYLPSPPLIRRLLAAGADPLDPLPDGQTALHCLIPALMDSSGEGRDSSFSSNEPDNTNSFLEHLTLYQTLTNAGCNREARDNEGNTPIFAYVRRAREYHSDVETRIPPDVNDLRRMFAEHDIHAVNNAGDTLLHAVAGREDDWDGLQDDDVLIFKLLVELGLDPKKENKDGATALDVAAAWERDEILGLFARDE